MASPTQNTPAEPLTSAARRALAYIAGESLSPCFLCGDSLQLLRQFPAESIDCVMTSPPYWGHRKYASPGIGLEESLHDYVAKLRDICAEIKRVLKKTGSFWLNIGDTYSRKNLVGVPWRVAIELTDRQNWILRNDVIWNKVKGAPDNSKDKLRNIHEHLFHFVKQKSCFYDVDAIRSTPRSATVRNGAVISATGVSGVRYRRQLELSTELTGAEKQQALRALEDMLQDVRDGRLADFRMVIRGRQRATHSDVEAVSGRARELREKGFYFLRYHPRGSKPSDVWDILPEDTQKRTGHFAPYPADLCRIPILATCPEGGLVLDPFCGTGTTNVVASQLNRRSIGIDLASAYIEQAVERCNSMAGPSEGSRTSRR